MVWFILGPSGAGKSSFGKWLSENRNWLHLEIDGYPTGDGIDLNNLRREWDEFYNRGDPAYLAEIVTERLVVNAKLHAALTFADNLVLSPNHMSAAASAGIRTIYLYGSAAHGITSFLRRERDTGRNPDLTHWLTNNRDSYIRISEPPFEAYTIHVFTHHCDRRPHNEVFEDLNRCLPYEARSSSGVRPG